MNTDNYAYLAEQEATLKIDRALFGCAFIAFLFGIASSTFSIAKGYSENNQWQVAMSWLMFFFFTACTFRTGFDFKKKNDELKRVRNEVQNI